MKKYKVLAIILLGVIVCNCGGAKETLFRINDNLIFAGSFNGQILKSINGGISWNIFSRIPNILTISRILLIPIIIMSLIGFRFGFDDLSNKTIIYSCLAYAFISDFLDGYIARKWKLESGFGRMIDPIADKLLVAGCLISYCIIYVMLIFIYKMKSFISVARLYCINLH